MHHVSYTFGFFNFFIYFIRWYFIVPYDNYVIKLDLVSQSTDSMVYYNDNIRFGKCKCVAYINVNF